MFFFLSSFLAGTLLRAEFPYRAGHVLQDSGRKIADFSLMTNHEQRMQKNMNSKISRIDNESAEFDHISVSVADRFRFMRSQTAGVFNLALDEDSVLSSPFTLLPSTRTTSSSTPSSSLLIAQYFPAESECQGEYRIQSRDISEDNSSCLLSVILLCSLLC